MPDTGQVLETKPQSPGDAVKDGSPIVRENIMHAISDNRDAVIDEYIRTRGVTRCPTACVVPTQASVNEADRAALSEYVVARSRQRREKAAARARLFFGIDLPLPSNRT